MPGQVGYVSGAAAVSLCFWLGVPGLTGGRVRYQVTTASTVNFSAEAGRLAEILKQYNTQDEGAGALFVPA